MRKEIVIAGFGGQGIQSLGRNLALALDARGFLVSLKSNYGPEARGGNSFSQVVIKESLEDWPEILLVDILVAMSQEGYDVWISKTAKESKILFDNSLVESVPVTNACQYPIPATKAADELGAQIAANMVMLGAFAAVTGLLSIDDLFKVLKKRAGKSADINLEAVKKGFQSGTVFKS